MNRLKKTYEKRNATQPKVNHKSHIQHIQTLTNEMEQLREREHRLAERLISEQPLINELRHSRKHSVNHVFSSSTSIINFTSKKPSYDDTRRSGRDNELLQRAQNDL